MNILLFGVTNVGKTTTGRLLAEELGYAFFDLDDEVKVHYGITLEKFVNTGTLDERDRKRGELLGELIHRDGDKVIAVTPMSHPQYFARYLEEDVLAVELRDTAENIFERLVFSDENDVIYKDDEYKNAHKKYFISDIMKDIQWYGFCYSGIKNKLYMHNDPPEEVVRRLIKRYRVSYALSAGSKREDAEART